MKKQYEKYFAEYVHQSYPTVKHTVNSVLKLDQALDIVFGVSFACIKDDSFFFNVFIL